MATTGQSQIPKYLQIYLNHFPQYKRTILTEEYATLKLSAIKSLIKNMAKTCTDKDK